LIIPNCIEFPGTLLKPCFKQYKLIQQEDLEEGLRALKVDGIFSQSMSVLISNAFLIPFLIMLGAGAFHIGLLAVISSLFSFSQFISINLMNYLKGRKIICVASSLLARLVILSLGLVIILGLRLNILGALTFIGCYYFLMNISNGAFTHWMLEFVPQDIRGKYFAERTRVALLIASLVSLPFSIIIEISNERVYENYGFLFIAAAILGLVGILFLSSVPEPTYKYQNPLSPKTLRKLLFSDVLKKHYKSMFLIMLSMQMALPFLVYYMITRLEMSIILVLIIILLGNMISVITLPKWGHFIDKYGVKSVLRFTAYLIFLSFLIWPFTTLPNKYILSIPLAFLAYLLMSTVIGGFNLSAGLIAYYLGNDENSSQRMILHNIIIALGSITGSLIGTLISPLTKYIELSLTFSITYMGRLLIFLIDLRELDFIFVIAAFLGISLISTLEEYKVETSRDEEKSYMELYMNIKRSFRNIADNLYLVLDRRRKSFARVSHSGVIIMVPLSIKEKLRRRKRQRFD